MSLVSKPRVSVIMSVHNGEKYLSEAIDSILAQTMRDFEFIIVDDGSRDQSTAIIRRYAQLDERIQSVILKDNVGLAAALNIGIGSAKSDYLARMDCDDRAMPHRLERQLNYITEHDLDIVGSLVSKIDAAGHVIGAKKLPVLSTEIKNRLPLTNCIMHPSIMMKKSVIMRAGNYDERFRNAQDYDLWLRCLPNARFGNVPENLLEYRYHAYKAEEKMNGMQQSYFSVFASLGYLARKYAVPIPAIDLRPATVIDWIASLYRQELNKFDSTCLDRHAFRFNLNCVFDPDEKQTLNRIIYSKSGIVYRFKNLMRQEMRVSTLMPNLSFKD